MVPPKIRFLTKIFHPNVDKLGRICLDVLKSTFASTSLFPNTYTHSCRVAQQNNSREEAGRKGEK